MNKYILYYSHNNLPEDMEIFFQEELVKASNGIPIVSVCKKQRTDYCKTFASINILTPNKQPSGIKDQMALGIEAILDADRDAIVYLAEHDVLYPSSYYNNNPSNDITFLKNYNLYFANKKGYIGPYNGYIHSQTIGAATLFDMCLKEDVHSHKKFKSLNGYTLERFNNVDPCIDIRHGYNVSGYRESSHYIEELPYWGRHSDLIKTIPSIRN